MTVEIKVGDALEVLRTMPDESVQCCITSPPYWGLRDYGTATWEGGNDGCDHMGQSKVSNKSTLKNDGRPQHQVGSNDYEKSATNIPYRHTCGKCGAIRIDKQLGLESTPEEYIANMVEVFREVRRVLRGDGTCWVNLGDSYVSTPPGTRGKHAKNEVGDGNYARRWDRQLGHGEDKNKIYKRPPNLKPKDLCGIPWRVALALQADGWWLRSDIIWAKPNPMPESVTDRPTKAHEYLFLLTKSARYFYDNDAVREDATDNKETFYKKLIKKPHKRMRDKGGKNETTTGFQYATYNPSGRNRRTVWTIATQPFSEAHFATFPTKLVEPMIKAGTSEKGCCPECGAPWERVTEKKHYGSLNDENNRLTKGMTRNKYGGQKKWSEYVSPETTGWQPTCDCCPVCDHYNRLHGEGQSCRPYDPIPCITVDPFAGAGTVGLVADRLNRDAILIELNPTYAEMARRRIADDAGWTTEVEIEDSEIIEQMTLL